MVKKGFYFSMDAFFSAIVLVVGAILLLSMSKTEITDAEYPDYFSKDVLNVLNELKISEVNDTWVQSLIANGSIDNVNNSVLSQIGAFWSENESGNAQKLSQLIVGDLIPASFGFGVYIEDEEIYEKNYSKNKQVVTFQRMITGIGNNTPTSGASTFMYVRKIADIERSAYVYFGGFIGQGNISVFMDASGFQGIGLLDLPEDINGSVNHIILELSVKQNFSFYINDDLCTSPDGKNEFMPVLLLNMSPTIWDISHCNSSITPGRNNFSIIFPYNLNLSFIGGGYLRIDYVTSEVQSSYLPGKKLVNFPEIDGVVNLYDSFYIPGDLNYMNVYLHYYFNHSSENGTLFMSVGDEIVYFSNVTEEVTYNVSNAILDVFLNYDNLSSVTVPIRIGLTDFSGIEMYVDGAPTDTILVTDISGSMAWCGEWSRTCTYRCRKGPGWIVWPSCYLSPPDVCNGALNPDPCGEGCLSSSQYQWLCSRTRMEIAKEADNLSIGIILNATGTRIGIVSFDDVLDSFVDLTTNETDLYDEIKSYTPDSATCVCCGIYKAFDMFSADNRLDYMIVLSDGDANRECDGPGDYIGSFGDGPGAAIAAGQYACNNSVNNVTVFTIGFGSDISAAGTNTLIQTACNASFYFNATNTSELGNIYRNISDLILQMSNYSSQIIYFQGDPIESNLYDDSYMYFEYDSNLQLYPNEISVTIQTDQFGACNSTVEILDGMRVVDAKVTSYSDEHWTDLVIVDNQVVYNLSELNPDYAGLGDPYIVHIPVSYLDAGTHTIHVGTGDGAGFNRTGCSLNNSFIYTVMINSSVPRGEILDVQEGCNWTVEFEDGTFTSILIPENHDGSNDCYYTAATGAVYNPLDAYDSVMYDLLDTLDLDDDFRVILNFDNIEIVVNTVTSIPYLWGPSILEVRVWV